MTIEEEYIAAGDIVAVRHGVRGRQEGLVVGSHVDYAGRQIIEVQLDAEVYHAYYPTVTRVRRVVSYAPTYAPTYTPTYVKAIAPNRVRTIERRVYW
ncbi:hypothetical protein CPB83DRAFT_855124 [Crepidotus variabilis]|uniref:Uncharacterized protein n=1 Tax=Crepidotus variabilis TaxID=179855 RepID=A0A9P6EFC3_9AGAR|nr:hypothetical protein CPB83DRAFT_855124 [Crepidotus variabilis]